MADDDETRRFEREMAQWRARQEASIELWRAQQAASMEHWRAQFEVTKLGFQAINTFAAISIRSLLILNGASSISILTFVGNQTKDNPNFAVTAWLPAFEVFGWGTFLAVLCSVLAYLSQVTIHEPDTERVKRYVGGSIRWLAVLAGALSLLAFIFGMYRAMAALAPSHCPVPICARFWASSWV
jgi:hypothetical protein